MFPFDDVTMHPHKTGHVSACELLDYIYVLKLHDKPGTTPSLLRTFTPNTGATSQILSTFEQQIMNTQIKPLATGNILFNIK